MINAQALQALVARQCDALVPHGARLMVAVSGGADSRALLHLLIDLAPSRAWSLAVAHYNHRQDPSIDDRAVTTLAALAQEAGLPFVTGESDLPPDSNEAALRQARYAFLADACRDWQASHLAVAHHLDDQAETVLLRLFRGAIAGLGAMKPARLLDETLPPVQLIRPFLGVRKDALHAYLAQVGIAPIADPSNDNCRFRRNVLRHEVLPLIVEQWPGVVPVLGRTAQWLADDEAYLQAEADRLYPTLPQAPWPIAQLLAWPGPLRRRILRRALTETLGTPPDSTALAACEAVLRGDCRKANLKQGWVLSRQGGWLSPVPEQVLTTGRPVPLTWDEQRDAPLGDWPFAANVTRSEAGSATAAPWTLVVPGNAAGDGWVWRGWQAGDRIQTTNGRVKVAELLRLQGMAAASRPGQLVLAAGSEVWWVVGGRQTAAWREIPVAGAAWRVTVRPTGDSRT